MAATSAPQTAKAEASALQEQAQRHLWMHFTRMGSFGPEHEVPIIVRGEGCYVWDDHGNRYLDGLSALFCVNSGHGRSELGDAMAAQVRELDFITVWSYAHPRAIELATRIASLAPGDLNRVFFTQQRLGGGRVGASSWRAAITAPGATARRPSWSPARSPTTAPPSAPSAPPGSPRFAASSSRSPRAGSTCRTRTATAGPPTATRSGLPTQIEERILFEGPETVAAVILEPLQNAGGCIPPQEGYFQRVREICDKYDVLLISDEVICAWGRLGHYFGCQRYGYQPDIVTVAKALTSAYVPMGGMIVSDRGLRAVRRGHRDRSRTGRPSPGTRLRRPPRMANLDVFEREDLCGHVLAKQGEFRAALESLYDIPIVGDVRGDGYFLAIELVKDKDTKEHMEDEESEKLLRGYLSRELYRRGLICRADDRGDPVVQLAPPLIADTEQFEEIVDVLRPVLEEAARRVGH